MSRDHEGEKGLRELSGVIGMFDLLTGVQPTPLYTLDKTDQIVPSNPCISLYVNFTLLKRVLRKKAGEGKIPSEQERDRTAKG